MEFYDYKTLPVSGNQVVDSTKTGMTFYDQFLTTKDRDYLNNVKNLQGMIVPMSPEEYYDACAKYGFPNSPVPVGNLKRTRRAQTKILDHLKDVLLVYKKRFPMPMLDIAQKGQEGLHRMMVIGDLFGWDHKVPVLVITHFDEDRARREEQERYKYDIDRNIERAIELACRYTYYSLEELEEQLTHEVATRFEFRDDIEVPTRIHINETSEGYTFTFSGFDYAIDKEDITMMPQDDLDDINTEDQLDFLVRYFGDDWEKEFPELRTKFGLSEAHADDTRKNIVKQAAKKARDYIVSKYGTETDLCGRCIEASEYLVDLLTDENIPAKAVEGYVIYDNDENCSDRAWDEHTWVELSDGTVVDVTVEQFNPMMDIDYPPILIQKNPHGYVYNKPDFLWLNERLTTRTSRRDNPDDFSPFGYKVDFYDGDYHIGEGSVCGIKDDNAFLYDFEVYPKYRGMGYSKEMLQYLIDQYDLKQLFVKPDNNIAINLYKKYGFEFDDDAYDSDDIGNMRLMIRESIDDSLKSIVNSIYIAYMKYGKGERLNQNCMLCTWAVELQLRGYDFLPRPVYSPNDVIFNNISGYDIIKNAEKISFSDYHDLVSKLNRVPTGRFYCHVNWAGSTGGHEFLLVKENHVIEIVDAQDNKIETLTPDSDYFNDINWKNSFIVRLDNKPINKDVLKYNDMKYAIPYDYKSSDESNLNEDLTIDGITTPDKLMDWMNDNITYELVDDEYSNSNGVPTKTAEEVLETKTGHCAEQSYLEKEILDELGYESFLVMVKENNSKKEYGAEGSAHVFLVYKDEKGNYCWFEHSMQHARGIHKYTNLDALLQDVANQWWRYDKNSDMLEVRFIDKYITGVDNWGLAKECYKYPVKYTFDISDNILESDVPLEESYHSNGDSISQSDIDAMHRAIVNEFGRDQPGEGCILIAPDGTFINVYPMLDDHEDLCTWLTEQGFDGVVDEAEWLVETFNYVRCRNNPESLCYIELPLHNITRQQLYSLEDWITEKVKHDHISIELPDGIWKQFSLKEYFPEDIIKKIKRYYASGKLYEKLK